MPNKQSDRQARAMQRQILGTFFKGRAVNSYKPFTKPQRCTLENGTEYVGDVCYGKKYPNSYADIWYSPENQKRRCPTYVYVHGGGFLFGDKVTGDPLSAENKLDMAYYKDLTARGFNIVSANYCFAPKYRAPAQFIQLDGLLAFLRENAEELSLDMENIVIGGPSAGANFAAIYGLILCDADYAKRVGVSPSIPRECVRALVIDEAALDVQTLAHNVGLKSMGEAWLGVVDLAASEKMRLYDVGRHIRSAYIPAFVNASNEEEVFKGTQDSICAAMERAGVEFVRCYRSKEEAGVLGHGFMCGFERNAYARECYEKMCAFIIRKTGIHKEENK